MSEADKTFGKCPACGKKTFMTGMWADGNPTLSNGKKACVDCKIEDSYAQFFMNKRD